MRGSDYVVAALSGAALAVTGCASDQEKAATDKAPLTTATDANDSAQTTVGSDLEKTRSAGATALTFIRDVRDGAGPVLLPAYDSRITQRIGTSNMIGALESVRQAVQQTTPGVARQRSAMSGELVTLRLRREEGKNIMSSFLLRRQGGKWIIAYDSLLAEGLRAYVQTDRANDPAKPSTAAVKAAARAVLDLKLAARSPLTKSKPKAKKPPGATTTPAGPGATTTTTAVP